MARFTHQPLNQVSPKYSCYWWHLSSPYTL